MSEIYDLLYFGEDRSECREAKEAMKVHLPDTSFEMTHDDIHGYRLCVQVKTSLFKYFQTLYEVGYLLVSFIYQTQRIRYPRRMLKFLKGMNKQEKIERRDNDST